MIRRLLAVSVLAWMGGMAPLHAAEPLVNKVEIIDAWAPLMPGGTSLPLYLIIQNHAENDDALVGASSSVAQRVDFYRHDLHKDVLEMSHVRRITIPAQGILDMTEEGYSLLLEDVNIDSVRDADTLPLKVRFAQTGVQDVKVTLRHLPKGAQTLPEIGHE